MRANFVNRRETDGSLSTGTNDQISDPSKTSSEVVHERADARVNTIGLWCSVNYGS